MGPLDPEEPIGQVIYILVICAWTMPLVIRSLYPDEIVRYSILFEVLCTPRIN